MFHIIHTMCTEHNMVSITFILDYIICIRGCRKPVQWVHVRPNEHAIYIGYNRHRKGVGIMTDVPRPLLPLLCGLFWENMHLLCTYRAHGARHGRSIFFEVNGRSLISCLVTQAYIFQYKDIQLILSRKALITVIKMAGYFEVFSTKTCQTLQSAWKKN